MKPVIQYSLAEKTLLHGESPRSGNSFVVITTQHGICVDIATIQLPTEEAQRLVAAMERPESRDGHYQIPAAQVEFHEGGNTVWVHNQDGLTLLRIKAMGGKIVVNAECGNLCAHADLIVQGDINFCVPREN